MKRFTSKIINDQITVIGNTFYPCYLIQGSRKNLLIDSGINLIGPVYLHLLDNVLGNKNLLDYLFLTHSHYDHVGSSAYLKRIIPTLVIGAHTRIAPLLQKESALAMMNDLSDVQRAHFTDIVGTEDVRIAPITVDLPFKEGDEIDLGGLTCRVYEVPGHTRDSLAYFIPEISALFSGEAAGVPEGENNHEPQVEFLSSYEDYLASLEKMIFLKPRILCMAHGGVLTGDDVTDFLLKSHAATAVYRRLIEKYLDETGGDISKTIEIIVRKEYDGKGAITQERNAYITNLTAQVNHVARLR